MNPLGIREEAGPVQRGNDPSTVKQCVVVTAPTETLLFAPRCL